MAESSQRRCVLICQNRSCLRSGAEAVLQEFRSIATPNVLISPSDCLGQCGSGPTVRVMPDDSWYCRIKPDDVETIATEHLQGDRPVARLLHPRFHPHPDAFKPS
ncbi:MAG: (2Fe-2S) ferredoxin domain-containing protein [Leptolyngbyaceae cyanobacterium SM1_3_5]|nr:(2Fe-2S) ferredoxin domain-containing protein [Leptolyngbyaceae cyanobacterium SM1_3_5]